MWFLQGLGPGLRVSGFRIQGWGSGLVECEGGLELLRAAQITSRAFFRTLEQNQAAMGIIDSHFQALSPSP